MSLHPTMKLQVYLNHAKALSRALEGAARTAANQKGCMQSMHGPNCDEVRRAEAMRAVYADHQVVIDAVIAKAEEELAQEGGGP